MTESPNISRRQFIKYTSAAGILGALGLLLPFKVRSKDLAGSIPQWSGSQTGTWVPSTCLGCTTQDAIDCYVEDVSGTKFVRKIKGHPDDPQCNLHAVNAGDKGRICPKGQSGLKMLDDPFRMKDPLKRAAGNTKGTIGGAWESISWADALKEVSDATKAAIGLNDPRKITFLYGRNKMGEITKSFAVGALGTENHIGHTSICELAYYQANEYTFGMNHPEADLAHCKLLVYFGSNVFEANTNHVYLAQNVMNSMRENGMKYVCVDPRFSHSAAKADQWISIKPATDGALLLALCQYVIAQDDYDTDYLIDHTNAAFLVGSDRLFLKIGGKEAILDADDTVKAYDDASVTAPQLNASTTYNALTYNTAFKLFKDRVDADYTPSKAAVTTGITESTITTLADQMLAVTEITVGGVTGRPVAVMAYRGAAMHENGFQAIRALDLLNMLLGSVDRPGGFYFSGTGKDFSVRAIADLVPEGDPKDRIDRIKSRFYPLATHNCYQQVAHTIFDPANWEYTDTEVLFVYYASPTLANPDIAAQRAGYAKLTTPKFVVAIDAFMGDFADQYADIILPDATYLERYDPPQSRHAPGYSGKSVRQPVIPAMYDTKMAGNILIDLLAEMGTSYQAAFYSYFDEKYLGDAGEITIDGSVKYTMAQLVDHLFTHKYADKPLSWFETNGVYVSTAAPEDMYERYGGARHKFYLEGFVEYFDNSAFHTARYLKDGTTKIEAPQACFDPLPVWFEPAGHKVDAQYDLYYITYKVNPHTHTRTAHNAWLMDLMNKNYLLMHPTTAASLGLAEDNEVTISADLGGTVVTLDAIVKGISKPNINWQGVANCQLTTDRAHLRAYKGIYESWSNNETIKPGVVAISAHFGHWAYGKLAAGKGISGNHIVAGPNIPGGTEPVSGAQAWYDMKVKVVKKSSLVWRR